MKRLLKKYLIPHDGNDHKPHFLRSQTALAIVGSALLIEVIFLLQLWAVVPGRNFLALVLPDVLVDSTNQTRVEASFGSLKLNTVLVEAARAKAQDMATKGYFAHISPDGFSPWYWLEKSGYSFTYAGENLAVNFADSEDVIKAWMDSPGHRANILNGKFTEIGIATAFGKYKGRDATFVVQFFGRPSAIAAKPAPIANQPMVVLQTEPARSATALTEMFVAVKGAAADSEAEQFINQDQAIQPPQSNFWEKLLAMPRTMTNYILAALSALVLLALGLSTFIKIRIQHPRLILNGFLLLLIIGAILAINRHLSLYNSQIF